MKLFTKRAVLITLFSFLIFSSSCEKENELVQIEKQESIVIEAQELDNEFFLSENDASIIAHTVEFSNVDSKTGKYGSSTKKIKNKRTVPDKNNFSAYYIYNYEEGGFLIVSADKRTEPILGYSEAEYFEFESKELPRGVLGWLEETSEGITTLRKNQGKGKGKSDSGKSSTVSLYSKACEYQKLVSSNSSLTGRCDDGDSGCQDKNYYYGPLMNSQWNQGNGFNNLLADMGCNTTGGRPPSGCVATAIGQVMRYHQSPSNYNYGNMPLNNNGSNEISRLLDDIGSAVNMNYACAGSGAQTSDGVGALKNTFGYSSATYASWNHTTTKNEIRAGRPVILAGHSTKSCFLWWCSYGSPAHAWVVEGYRSHFYCSTGSQYTYYFMNWGWGGQFNGYFSYNSWTPSSFDFKYNKKMIYNIKP